MLAGTFTALIAFIWLYHVPAKLAAIEEKQNDDAPAFSDFFGNMTEQIANIKKAANPEPEEAVDPAPTGVAANNAAGLEWTPYTASDERRVATTTGVENGFSFASTTASSAPTGVTQDPVITSRPIRIVTVSAAASGTASSTNGQ